MERYFKNCAIKRILTGVIAATLVVTGLYLVPREAEAADAVTVITAKGQTYIEQREVDGYIGEKAPKPVTEEYANWLFAGWYEDAACTSTPITDTSYTGAYYAKYVPEEVLSVKYQVSTDTSADAASSSMRLVSTVDGKLYSKVGFIIEIDDINYSYTSESGTVYTSIVSSTEGVEYTHSPSVFQYTSSKYFITATIINIPDTAFGYGVRVTPYWKTLDGTEVKGASRCARVEDSYLETVNVPVRTYSDVTAASGSSFAVSYDSDVYTYTGLDQGTLTSKVTATDDGAGTITCTLGEAVTADGMLANLRFTKKDTTVPVTIEGFGIASESVTDWNSSYGVYHNLELAVTDGKFPADVLYNHSSAWYNNETKKTTSLTDGVLQCVPGVGGALKSMYVENISLNTADFTKMSFKIRDKSNNVFTLWRLYINPDSSASTAETKRGTQVVGTASELTGAGTFDSTVNSVTTTGVVTVSEADTDGWYTVTMDLSNVSAWTSAGTITGFNLGYLNGGTTQEVAEIQFIKTDGKFSTSTLYNMTESYYSNTTNSAEKLLQDTGVKYDFLDYSHGGLRDIYIENLELETELYHTLTFRVRSLSADASGTTYGFTRWRLYINPDSSATTEDARRGTMIVDTGNSSYNSTVVSTSTVDSDGWFTVTIDLSSVSQWLSAGTVSGINIGYLNSGAYQEISDLQFLKKTDGDFSATYLNRYGTAVYDNGTKTEYPNYQSLLSTGVKLSYSATANIGGKKGMDVDNIELSTCEFDTMVIRLRPLDNNVFVRYLLSLETDVNGALTEVLNIDPVGNDLLTENGPDASGWYTVTIDLDEITTWTEATTLTSFNFSYVNYGATQEIAEIQFTKTKGDFSADTLYALSTPIHNNVTTDITAEKTLTSTGVRYTFDNTYGTSALKSVHVTNLNLIPGRYDTMTVKLRGIDNTTFSRYRLYLLTDQGGSLVNSYVIDSTSTNASYLTASSADSDGWITLTIDLTGLSAWTGADEVTAFALGYVNAGYVQEIGDIQFTTEEAVTLVYGSSSYMSKRYAYRLSTEVAGLENATFDSNVTSTTRSINVVKDTTLESGTATITVNGLKTICTIADYYGFEAVIDYFKANGHIMTDGTTVTVDYLNNISGLEISNKYAYAKSGEIRAMFYNVLWEGSSPTYYPAEQRDYEQAEVIGAYMPDVLGLQERNDTRSTLYSKIVALGYSAVSANATSHCTPLLYNPDILTEVDSGYTKFTGGSDASKSMTWGIFKAIDTGDTFLVVNTHMYTNDVTYNLSNAQEIEEKISSLLSSYGDIPVIIGGDYNSMSTEASSYDYIKNTMGYTDVALSATNKSVTRAHHDYPVETTFSEMGLSYLWTPGTSNLSASHNGSLSVDHIMVNDTTDLSLNVYGVVVDYCTEVGGDHFPVFMDFDIGETSSDSDSGSDSADSTTLTLSASELNTYGTPVWDRTQANYTNGTNVTSETLLTDSLQYVFTSTGGSLRGLYIDLSSTSYDLTPYSTMTFKLKFASGTTLNHCRFYFKADSGTSVLASTATYTAIGSYLTVGTQDSDGWMTVTVDLSSISGWSSATKINELFIGYVPSTYSATSSLTQEISAITFTK